MQNIHIIKRTFLRQSDVHDCGIACLAMIFNSAGKSAEVPELRATPIKPGGASLLDLRNIANRYSLHARCVEMQITFLRGLASPCILHTTNTSGDEHFQVCYGSKRFGSSTKYLVADPAQQVYYVEESRLEKQWASRAALFFDDFHEDFSAFQHPSWQCLWSFKTYPSGILFAVPLLSLFSASAGVALSWLLEKGMGDNSLINGRTGLLLLSLLFIINLFKSLITYLRQYILIKISLSLNSKLMEQLITRVFYCFSISNGNLSRWKVKNSVHDIQKMQNATSHFIAIALSDSALVILMMSAICYELPLAALISLVYLAAVTYLTLSRLPQTTFDMAHLHHLSGATENFLLKDVGQLEILEKSNLLEKRKKIHIEQHRVTINSTETFALRSTKLVFLLEALGTVHVILVFVICLWELDRLSLGYNDLIMVVILSYLTSSVVPKISNALSVVSDGADASIQFRDAVQVTLETV